MQIKKTLLLSAAIPLLTLSMTPEGLAAQVHVATAATLLAQADSAGDQGDNPRKKRHDARQGKKDHGDKGHTASDNGGAKSPPASGSRTSNGAQQQKPEASGDAAKKVAPKSSELQKQPQAAPAHAESGKAPATPASKPERRKSEPARHDKHHDQKADHAKPTADQAKQSQSAQPANGSQQQAKPASSATAPSSQRHDQARQSRQGEAQKPRQGSGPANAAKPRELKAGDSTGQPATTSGGQAAKDKAPSAKPGAEPAPKGHADRGKGNSASGTDQTSLPGQPTRQTAAPASDAAKPESLDATHGTPVLDSAKEQGAGRGRTDNRATGQDLSKGQTGSAERKDRNSASRQENRHPVHIDSAEKVQGKPVKQPPAFRLPQNARVEKRTHDRVILNIDNRTVIENNDYRRVAHDARDVRYEDLSDGRTRQVVVRPNGVRVVTIRNRYGDIVHRSRIGQDGQETVLIYAPRDDRHDRSFYRDPAVDLPPIRLREPADHYVLEGRGANERQYVTFLEKPPIERIPHVYTLDQVRYSARLRDVMPRIDLDTITFPTGSSDIGPQEAQSLSDLADAIRAVLQKDPGQIFLIEGHTDAVGSAQSNLVLSDERAESVASVLTQNFGVPPENLVTQGYGEQYLKIDSQGPERANRRVTVRRITPLVRPTASR